MIVINSSEALVFIDVRLTDWHYLKVLFFLSLQLEPTLIPKYFTMLNEIKKTQKEDANNN
ncbi:hypothetical protein [Aliivibrio sifiae]|uniref:hypothetical protein n=1 Tax=Aliivibrio sifiae TaxID=566293 RepID=UPI0015E3AF58|nr:hypothetical protein [Aliivibrio sifiae]